MFWLRNLEINFSYALLSGGLNMYVLCCFSVAYNNRMRQFVILDSKGITTWKRDQVDPRGK